MENDATTIFTFFFCVLLVWSVSWLVLSAVRLIQHSKHKYVWLTHAGWALVNIAIVVFGFYTVNNATLDKSFIELQRNIVAVNVLLDVVYVLVAYKLLRSTKVMFQEVGHAVRVQGAFLFFFDIVFAVALSTIL